MDESTPASTARRASIGAAVLAAIAASSCCVGPLILAALGIGGAGAFATLAAYRAHILTVTVVLLAAGFYLTYRKPRAIEGDACGCERPRASRAGKIGLWMATGLVMVFAASPTLIAKLLHPQSASAAFDPSVPTDTAVIMVQGADCEACAAHMKTVLEKVGGFHDLALDVRSQSLAVTYEPAPRRLDAYVAAINHLGYEATIDPTRTRAPR